MPATTYNYTATVDVGRVRKVIHDSAITIKLTGVEVSPPSVDVTFADALSPSEKSLLDGIMITDLTTPLPKDGKDKVEIFERKGTSLSFPSHNFCDKTTWYQQSVEVTGEAPTAWRTGYYGLQKRHIIDVYNGKVAFEDPRHLSYGFKAYDDGTPLTYGTDYEVNWDMGILLLKDYAPQGTITCDYHYAGSSAFTVAPPGSKLLYVHKAEIQFGKDIRMNPIRFNLKAGEATIVSDLYKNLDNLVDVGKEGKGEIPAVDTLRTGRLVFPVVYDPPIILDPLLGMKIECLVENDLVMAGERATITFYTQELDD